MTSWRRHQYPYDTHPWVVIYMYDAKFDVCMLSSFRGVKAYIRTYKHKHALYIEICYSVARIIL